MNFIYFALLLISACVSQGWSLVFDEAKLAVKDDLASVVAVDNNRSNASNDENRIYLGNPVYDISKAPYVVIVLKFVGRDISVCSGTLVSPKFVVTTAHCVLKEAQQPPYELADRVIVMAHKVKLLNRERGQEDFGISKIHYDYRYDRSDSIDKDLALLELVGEVTNAHPIDHSHLDDDPEDMTGMTAQAYGWGLPNEFGSSNTLREGTVEIIPFDECKRYFDEDLVLSEDNGFRRPEVTDRHICTKGSYQQHCKGDSGGPLLVNGKVVGITSFSTSICGSRTPTVHIRIASAWNDIKAVVDP